MMIVSSDRGLLGTGRAQTKAISPAAISNATPNLDRQVPRAGLEPSPQKTGPNECGPDKYPKIHPTTELSKILGAISNDQSSEQDSAELLADALRESLPDDLLLRVIEYLVDRVG